jgi:hypothetical protein
MANIFELTNTLGQQLAGVLVRELKAQRVLWSAMPEADQESRSFYLTEEISKAARVAAKQILSAGVPSVVADLKRITIQDGVNATLLFGAEQLHALTDRVGTKVVLVLCDPEDHIGAIEDCLTDLVDDDQGALPLDHDAATDDVAGVPPAEPAQEPEQLPGEGHATFGDDDGE